MTQYISLALSDTMFPDGQFSKESMTPQEAKEWLEIYEHDIVSAANPTHTSTFDALNRKFGINLPIPEKAPTVSLVPGDTILIFQARLPRLAEGERHAQETVDNAQFSFSLWTI